MRSSCQAGLNTSGLSAIRLDNVNLSTGTTGLVLACWSRVGLTLIVRLSEGRLSLYLVYAI